MLGEGKNLVGVDIGASAIKVVQLKEARKKLQVIRYGFAPLPPQSIIDGHVMNSGAVVESLMRIFHDSKITQKDVAIGVYGQSVIVRKITVPMMTNDELEEQIGWEAVWEGRKRDRQLDAAQFPMPGRTVLPGTVRLRDSAGGCWRRDLRDPGATSRC